MLWGNIIERLFFGLQHKDKGINLFILFRALGVTHKDRDTGPDDPYLTPRLDLKLVL